MTKAELNFVKEMTRKHLVGWCHRTLVGTHPIPAPTALDRETDIRIYVEFAQQKGWLSADGSRVLAAGFNTAAAFLRR